MASAEDRQALMKALDARTTCDKDLIDALQYQSKSTVEHWFGDDLTYSQILRRAYSGIGSTVDEMEDAIAKSVFDGYRKSLTPEQREKLDRDLERIMTELVTDSGFTGFAGGILAAQLVAQVSGFGVFMMASSVVGGLTSAVGVTLPFAIYTGMSSLIATVIGPFGIAVSALILLGGLFRSEMSRTQIAVFHLTRLRISLGTKHLTSLASEEAAWLGALTDCSSLRAAENVRAEVNDCAAMVHEARGHQWLIGMLCLILDHDGSELAKAAQVLQRSQLEKLATDTVELCRRLAPDQLDALFVSLLVEHAPDELLRHCFRETEVGTSSYERAYFHVARRIARITQEI